MLFRVLYTLLMLNQHPPPPPPPEQKKTRISTSFDHISVISTLKTDKHNYMIKAVLPYQSNRKKAPLKITQTHYTIILDRCLGILILLDY